MKLLFIIFFTTIFLFSSNLSRLYKFYEKQEYDKACDYAHKYFYKKQNIDSQNYLTLYGLSCLETDNIARVAIPMTRLTKSKDARANASYFGTILLQKQLLYQALMDKKPLVELHLPTTDFIISKIFNLFVKGRYSLEDNIYRFKDRDRIYQLYIKKVKKNRQYLIIDIYKNSKFTKRYQYR